MLSLIGAPLVLIGLLCLSIFVGDAMHRSAIDGFNRRTSDAAMLGATPAQVIHLLGTPVDDNSDRSGDRERTYKGPYGSW